MANKLPWFKHDHDARHDDFIFRAEDRFGHFGYSAYFKLLETLHTHGVGDKLCITKLRLALELGTRWTTARQFLDFCQSSSKVSWEEVGDNLTIEVKNFRKKQRNKFRENTVGDKLDPPKTLLDKEEEEEGDKERLGFLDQLKRMASGFRIPRWLDKDLEEHRVRHGKHRDIKVIDMTATDCQWQLDNVPLDSKTKAAFIHRVKLKRMESAK